MSAADVLHKSLTDCFFFVSTGCAKGDACEFRHNESARVNRTDCKFWISGKCKNPSCMFRHPTIPMAMTTKPATDPSKIPCHFEMLPSGCTKGSACPFKHIKQSSAVPEPAQPAVITVSATPDGNGVTVTSTTTSTSNGATIESSTTEKHPSAEALKKLERQRKGTATADLNKVIKLTTTPLAPTSGFVKALAEIIKEPSSTNASSDPNTQVQPDAAPARKKLAVKKVTKSEIVSTKQEAVDADSKIQPRAFGIKSFQQILAERQQPGVTIASTNTANNITNSVLAPANTTNPMVTLQTKRVLETLAVTPAKRKRTSIAATTTSNSLQAPANVEESSNEADVDIDALDDEEFMNQLDASVEVDVGDAEEIEGLLT